MNGQILLWNWKSTTFIDLALDLDFIPQLYLSSPITEVLQRLISILFIKPFRPSVTKEEETVWFWTIKETCDQCSSGKIPLAVLLDNLDQTELLCCNWGFDWCSTIMSCKVHIILLRRIQRNIFYGEGLWYKKVVHANVVLLKLASVTSGQFVGKKEEKNFVPLLIFSLYFSEKKEDFWTERRICNQLFHFGGKK